ncbi:MAG: galactokinase, partial [Firmicutes bacterium]|nr:galactokinase [Bacillota bacterium]
YFFNGDLLDRVELAKIGQAAETGYFGNPCGLLDQMGVALGGVNYIDFLSTENPVYKHMTLTLRGYQIILTNTGGSHAGLTPFYAAIKDDMKKVARYFGKDYLREVPETDFRKEINEVRVAVGPTAVDRAIHFYEENARVEKAFSAIEAHDTKTFLAMVRESGQSSRHYLKNISIGHPETEALTIGLDLSEKLIHDGAVRVHGGGFAGTMQAFVADSEAKSYLGAMQTRFGKASSLLVKARPDGVKALKTKWVMK